MLRRTGWALLVALTLTSFACSPHTDQFEEAAVTARADPKSRPLYPATPESQAVLQGGCPATIPNGRTLPEFIADRGDPQRHAVGEMGTVLPLNGLLTPARAGPALSFSWSFDRVDSAAPLEVSGRRLDASGPAPPTTVAFINATGPSESRGRCSSPALAAG